MQEFLDEERKRDYFEDKRNWIDLVTHMSLGTVLLLLYIANKCVEANDIQGTNKRIKKNASMVLSWTRRSLINRSRLLIG